MSRCLVSCAVTKPVLLRNFLLPLTYQTSPSAAGCWSGFSRAGNVKSTKGGFSSTRYLVHSSLSSSLSSIFPAVSSLLRVRRRRLCLPGRRNRQRPKNRRAERKAPLLIMFAQRDSLSLSLSLFSAPAVFSPFDTSRPDRLPRPIMYSNGKEVGFGGAGNPGGTDETFFFFSPFLRHCCFLHFPSTTGKLIACS